MILAISPEVIDAHTRALAQLNYMERDALMRMLQGWPPPRMRILQKLIHLGLVFLRPTGYEAVNGVHEAMAKWNPGRKKELDDELLPATELPEET